MKIEVCPFCGLEASIICIRKEWLVYCKNCYTLGQFKQTKKQAIQFWNQRKGEIKK